MMKQPLLPIPFSRSATGFSLLEVMIVVAIIGILVTLAYPRLQQYLVSSRQTEARTNLMAIYTAQKIYHASNREYATDLDQLGVEIAEGGDAMYAYTLQVNENGFTASATGNIDDDATQDTWTIDQAKILTNTVNDVTD